MDIYKGNNINIYSGNSKPSFYGSAAQNCLPTQKKSLIEDEDCSKDAFSGIRIVWVFKLFTKHFTVNMKIWSKMFLLYEGLIELEFTDT